MNALCLGKSAVLSIQYVLLHFKSPCIILTYHLKITTNLECVQWSDLQ